MRILLLTHAFNSLAQRLFVALRERGDEVSVEFDINDRVTEEAVSLFRPDVVVAPFLKRAIPESVWRSTLSLIVHPGIRGDRGPSALDWAILEGEADWGVTVVQAEAEMDAGPVWGAPTFTMRPATKSSLYRNEVTEAAESAVLAALDRLAAGDHSSERVDPQDPAIRGRWRPGMKQADRAIDWSSDDTEKILRKVRSADGRPGLRDAVLDTPVWLFDAHADPHRTGTPGSVIARRRGAVCIATVDGSVWFGHMRDRTEPAESFKLPAATVLAERLADVPEAADDDRGYVDIGYEEADGVGVLHFPFYNGAMSAANCERLRAAYQAARQRDTRVIVLAGGPDFWSNGMDLNVIEAAASPADESWRNINAIDDIVGEVIATDDRLVITAMQGNAGAGGVFMALAADRVVARDGIVLNPHYKGMGNLYGSEYWTYLLPRRAGAEKAEVVTQARLPMGVREACRLGLADDRLDGTAPAFLSDVVDEARRLAADPALDKLLAEKRRRRTADESEKSLESYRAEELERMRLNFYGFDPSYHVARSNFVRSVPKSRTPLTIARHRRRGGAAA